MAKSKDVFGTFQRTSMLIVYALLVTLVFAAGVFAILRMVGNPGAVLALFIISLFILSLLVGAWLWVIVTLPQEMARNFDLIKNQIATGEISSINDFSFSLAEFLVKFFTFFGFDVVYASVKIKHENVADYPNDQEKTLPLNDEWIELSKKSPQIVYLGHFRIHQQKLFGYLIPVWFGDEWLGYFCVYTDSRLISLYKTYLLSFKENYVDDQLLHVLHRDNLKDVQKLCNGIDYFSGKISSKEIVSLEQYSELLMGLLLKETGCKAGYIISNLVDSPVYLNVDKEFISKIEMPESDKTIQTGEEKFSLAYVKKISYEPLFATILLFDNNYEKIMRARSLLESCLSIKVAKQYLKLRSLLNNDKNK